MQYVKNGKITECGKAFENGLCWGMWFAGLLAVIVHMTNK